MNMDNRESKGLGTLLHVTNLTPNSLVSSSKDLMEPSSNLSNPLMTTGPRLKGKTLHIKASFLEWIAIH